MAGVVRVARVAGRVVEGEVVGMGVEQVRGVQDNKQLDAVNIGGHVMVG